MPGSQEFSGLFGRVESTSDLSASVTFARLRRLARQPGVMATCAVGVRIAFVGLFRLAAAHCTDASGPRTWLDFLSAAEWLSLRGRYAPGRGPLPFA
jgi:hypothetical protein